MTFRPRRGLDCGRGILFSNKCWQHLHVLALPWVQFPIGVEQIQYHPLVSVKYWQILVGILNFLRHHFIYRMSKCSASKIGSGRLTNMWDAAAITVYLRCNFEYCRMPGMPRYTLSILKLVGNSGTRGFWDVPHDLTNDCCTNFELLSGLSTKMATCFEAGNWLIPLCTLYNCMSPSQSFRDFPDMVFGICLHSPVTSHSISGIYGGWFRCSGCSKICLSTSKLFTHKSIVTSHLKAWLIGILILVWFIDHNPGPV